MTLSVSLGDPLGISTEAILAGERDSGVTGKQNALTTSNSGEETLMSLSRMASMSERENREIQAANASGHTPVVFIHGLWLLPSSWASRACRER